MGKSEEKKTMMRLSGVESGLGHGQLCHRCGTAYPNPHPSAKQRRAHRKHCSGSIGGAADVLTVPDARDDADLKKEGSAEEALEGKEEMSMEELKTEGEVQKPSENGILVNDVANDDILESYSSLVGNNIEGSQCMQTLNKIEVTSQFKGYMLAKKADNAGNEGTKVSYSLESRSQFLDALKEDGPLHDINNIELVNESMNEIPLDFARATFLPGDSERSSCFIASKLHKINESSGGNETFNHHSKVTSPTIVLSNTVSINMMEFDSHIFSQLKQTNKDGGQLLEQELLYKDGLFAIETNSGGNFDTNSQLGPDNLVPELLGSQKIANETEHEFSLLVTSLTTSYEVSEARPEVSQEFAEDTAFHVTDVGVKSGKYLEDENPKILPAELVAVESKDIPSTMQLNDKISPCNDSGSAVESPNPNDDPYENSWSFDADKSQCAISMVKGKISDVLEVDLKIQEKNSILGSRTQENDFDTRDNSLHGTSFSSAQSEELAIEPLSEEHVSITTSSSEWTSAGCARAESFDIIISNLKQSSEAVGINSTLQLTSVEVEHVDNDVKDVQPAKVLGKKWHVETEKSSDSELHMQAQEIVDNTDTERNELLKKETMADHYDALSLQYAELSPRHLDNVAESHLIQPADQEVPAERLRENGIGDSFDHSGKSAELHAKEAKTEINLCEELNDKLDPHKMDTEIIVHTHGSQPEMQNMSDFRRDGSAVINEINMEGDCQISQKEEESIRNTLNQELHSTKSIEVGLEHDEVAHLRIKGHPTAMDEWQLFDEDPATFVDSKDCIISGVAPSTYYPSSQQQEVHVKSKQQLDSFMPFMDKFGDSNVQTGNTEEPPWTLKSDGKNPFLDDATYAVTFNDVTSLPTYSQNEMDLHTYELATEVLVAESKVDSQVPKEPSVTPARAGERLVSNEILSANNSKHQHEGNNNEEVSTEVAKMKTEKAHVMLKSLLAEANDESRRKLMSSETNDSPSSMAKKTWASPNGQPLRTSSPRIPPEKSNEFYDRLAEHKEWNSPARLPSPKRALKKIKRKQGWIPFICCQSMP